MRALRASLIGTNMYPPVAPGSVAASSPFT